MIKERILFCLFKICYKILFKISFYYLLDLILNEMWYKAHKNNYININKIFLKNDK